MTRVAAHAAPRPAAPAELVAILELLRRATLPTSDVESRTRAEFWVTTDDGRVTGAVGLERHGRDGLLRSLVVDPADRDRGLGGALVEAVERDARASGIRRLVLLTETAQSFFERRGDVVTPRDSIMGPVAESAEFRSLCPASATCMTRSIG